MGVVKRGRFGAKVVRNGRQIWLGTFATQAEAEVAIAEFRARHPRNRPVLERDTIRVGHLAPHHHDPDYRRVLRRDPCAYCGGAASTIDHIDPMARGGADDWMNLTAACGACNGSKSHTPLLRFLAIRVERLAIVRAEDRIRQLRGSDA